MIVRSPVDELQRSCFSCSNHALLHGPPRWPFAPANPPSVYAKIDGTGQLRLSGEEKMRRLSARQLRVAFDKQRRRIVIARPGCHAFIIVCDGLKSAFNIGKIFRSAEAFGAQAVHLVGIDCFNPYPAQGTLRQVPAKFFGDFEQSYQILCNDGYTPFDLQPATEVALPRVVLPKRSALVMGHEEFGPSFTADHYPDITPIRISMYGQVESLNVSVAASIVMYEYVRHHSQ
jgi:tRNA G18 (ribose-2'-O)-methylase SpoU